MAQLQEPPQQESEPEVRGLEDQQLEELLHQNRRVIEAGDRLHTRQDVYNIRLNDTFTIDNLIEQLRNIYNRQHRAFKVNLSFSFVLRNVETGELRFFYASTNTNLLSSPMLVHNEQTFRDFIEVLRTLDVLEWVRNQRPNSKWTFYRLIQALVTLTRLNVPVGAPVVLPHYIARHESIISLLSNRHTGEPYRDNLCFFRCLALQAGEGESSLERATTAYFERYIAETSQAREDFCGVDLTELGVVEELFAVSIYVYSIDEHNQAVCIRRSVKQFSSMHVNLYENHFGFIKDIQSYSNCFICTKCDKNLFKALCTVSPRTNVHRQREAQVSW